MLIGADLRKSVMAVFSMLFKAALFVIIIKVSFMFGAVFTKILEAVFSMVIGNDMHDLVNFIYVYFQDMKDGNMMFKIVTLDARHTRNMMFAVVLAIGIIIS